MEKVIVDIVFAIAIAGIIWMNVCRHKRRAKMTPFGRLLEDARTAKEMQIW